MCHVQTKLSDWWDSVSLPFTLILQSSKVLAKKELSYMPIIGWMWYFLEIVFCKRKWEEDRKTVMQKLLNLRDYPENFWVSDD